MFERDSASGSYEEALNIIGEYVNFTEASQPKSKAEQFDMKMECKRLIKQCLI